MIQLNMHKSCGTYSGYTIHIRDRTEICEPCRKASRIYQKNKRDERVKSLGYDPRRFSRHNMSREKYDEMIARHNGKCWVCKEREAVNIDHDHSCCSGTWSCGKCIRGVLCNRCNTALGLMQDDKKILSKAISYLEETK
jgi:hypothetical protein